MRPLSRRYPKAIRTQALLAGATVCVLLLSAAAGAFELPTVGGIDAVGGELSSFKLEFGAFYGNDTNVSSAPDGSEQSDGFLRILGSMVFSRGSERRKFDLQIHAKADAYSELNQFDTTETRALLGLQTNMNSILMSLRAEYAMLADQTDIGLTDLMERTTTSVLPSFDLRLGKMMELSIGYSIKSADYEDAFDYLDYDETSIKAELRWGRKNGGRQVFVHFDKGEFVYGPGIRDDDDFEFNRLYLGFRTEVSRSTHEFSAGTSDITDLASLTSSEIYATYRATFKLNERRTLLLGVAHGPEAAANAEYKVATRILASFRQKVNTRWNWSLGLTNESADYVTPDLGFADNLSRITVNAGASMTIGTPDRMRGRLYATVGYEMRDGPDASFVYSRMRTTIGLSLVR
jgi:hypothetical protein